MHVYPVLPDAASNADGGEAAGGSLMVAVRPEDLVTPLRNGRLLEEGDRSALVIGGTRRIRTGERLVFLKVVAVAPARVRRGGRVQAQGSPVHHAMLGPYLFRPAGATSPFSPGLTSSWPGEGMSHSPPCPLIAAWFARTAGRVKGRDREATPQGALDVVGGEPDDQAAGGGEARRNPAGLGAGVPPGSSG